MAGTSDRGLRFPEQQRSGMGPLEGSSASGMAGAVKDKAQQMASSVANVAEEAWDSTRQGVQQAASAVASTTGEAWDSLKTCMSSYPFATFLTGIGLGFVLAKALDNLSVPRWRDRSNPFPRDMRS